VWTTCLRRSAIGKVTTIGARGAGQTRSEFEGAFSLLIFKTRLPQPHRGKGADAGEGTSPLLGAPTHSCATVRGKQQEESNLKP
jgi:hypothetical protein